MGYARNVGRLGALAVALGIGYAVTDAPAFADPSDPSADAATTSSSPARSQASPGPARAARHARPASAAAAARRQANTTLAGLTAPKNPAPSGALSDQAAPQPAPARVQAARAIVPQGSSAPVLVGSSSGGAQGQSPLLSAVLAWARGEFGRNSKTAVTATGPQSPNLLVNPGAEMSTPSGSGFSAVSMPGWTVTGTPTVIEYGTLRVVEPLGLSKPLPDLPAFLSFPKAKNGPGVAGGKQFFGGGNVANSTISQTVDLSAAGSAIDGGGVSYNLSGWLGGYSFDPSRATIKVTFLDANNKSLGTGKVGPVTALGRLFAISLLERSTSGVLPAGTRTAQVDVVFDDKNPVWYGLAARYNDAFADNISFTVGTDLPAPADPQPIDSTPPPLDHMFLFYMENKGYTNIVGSKNAPYTNSLINTYGFADNYYALTHGSLPNYYPIVGGDNFGITYNCASPCIDATTTLVSNIENAGKTWKDYAQGLAPGGDPLVSTEDYSFAESPFPAFTSIANDPDIKAKIVPLEQLALDLQSPASTPNWAWVDANEANNGEGPVDTLGTGLKFLLNQLDPQHQYNVKALDNFLSENVSTILESNAWNSAESSVVVVTFDEDNNNLSLGFGNEGNHIVTVVIPNQAAIDAGWRGGAFTAGNQYNHYSLLRMIEDSLGLPTLTNNDKFAAPMNEFWDGAGNRGGGSLV